MRGTVVAVMCFTGLAIFGSAQAPSAPPRPAIIGYIPQVADLEAAGRFYHDLLGLESMQGDPRARLTWYPTRPFLHEMYGVEGRLRNLALRVPMSDLLIEPIQWSDASGKPLHPRLQDPGATRLILTVSNIDTLVGRLKQGGAKALTSGGMPVSVADDTGTKRVILFEDFNGFYVELVQRQALPPRAPEVGPLPYVYGAALSVTVADLDQSARFFREVLGLDVTAETSFRADAKRLQELGLRGALYREAAIAWPDETPQLHLLEVMGVDRKVLEPLVADPNAALVRLNVRDMDSTLAKVKAFPGAKVMNLSGGPYLDGRNLYLIVRVPAAGIYLQIIGPSVSANAR
jgi:catechol 2,3-dioxygenase-like lactoylglutathione lyase family enzyme